METTVPGRTTLPDAGVWPNTVSGGLGVFDVDDVLLAGVTDVVGSVVVVGTTDTQVQVRPAR